MWSARYVTLTLDGLAAAYSKYLNLLDVAGPVCNIDYYYMRKDTLTVDQRVRSMRAKKEQVGPCDGQEKQQGTAQVQ